MASIEAVLQEAGRVRYSYKPELQQILQTMFKFETEFACFVEKPSLSGILGEIRGRVLRWAIALDRANIRGEGLSFSDAEKRAAHTIVLHADSGSITVGMIGDVSGQASIATGSAPHAATNVAIQIDAIQQLTAEVAKHITDLNLPPSSEDELKRLLAGLNVKEPNSQVDTGMIRKSLYRALKLVEQGTEFVVRTGIKALIEGWLKAHGLA